MEQLARMHLWLNDKLLSASEEADILLFKFWLWQVRLHCINAHIRLRNYKAVCLVIFSTGYFLHRITLCVWNMWSVHNTACFLHDAWFYRTLLCSRCNNVCALQELKALIDEAQERYAKEELDQAVKMDLMQAQIVLLTRLSRVLLQVYFLGIGIISFVYIYIIYSACVS